MVEKNDDIVKVLWAIHSELEWIRISLEKLNEDAESRMIDYVRRKV